MTSTNKNIKKNVELYVKWIKNNIPEYTIENIDYKKNTIHISYKLKAIWTSTNHLYVKFNENGDITSSTEFIKKMVWDYNKEIWKESLNIINSEKKNDKEKEKINYLKLEAKREKIEKYKTKQFKYIWAIPAIIIIAVIWYAIYIWISDWELTQSNKDFLLNYISPLFITFIIYWAIDDWDNRLEAKTSLLLEDKLQYEMDYEDDYFYTDSLTIYILYNIVRLVFIVYSWIVILWLGYLGYNLLWNISIAPTTIIIILLIIIIYNQNKIKNKNDN